MPSVDINFVAVAIATLLAMVIGSLWYAPFVFGEKWKKLAGLTNKQLKEGDKVTPMVAMVVLAFVQAVVLVHFIAFARYFYPENSNLEVGLYTGFWAWLGLVVPALGGSYLFAQRRKKLLAIDATNVLITVVSVSALLAVW